MARLNGAMQNKSEQVGELPEILLVDGIDKEIVRFDFKNNTKADESELFK